MSAKCPQCPHCLNRHVGACPHGPVTRAELGAFQRELADLTDAVRIFAKQDGERIDALRADVRTVARAIYFRDEAELGIGIERSDSPELRRIVAMKP